ncbi:MAG: phage portal protein [Pseudomonadota bacterium]
MRANNQMSSLGLRCEALVINQRRALADEQRLKAERKQPGYRMFEGAEFGRLFSDWVTSSTSHDSELRSSLRTLRNRSRQLVRDNEFALNAVRLIRNNVVGMGVGFQAKVKMRRGDKPDTNLNKAIQKSFLRWKRKGNCHTAGLLNFNDIERLIIGEVVESGEILVRMIRRPFGKSKIPFALEIIEADQLSDERNSRAPNGNEIRMGVEVDEWQRPVAYWVYPRHPGDYQYANADVGSQLKRIPAEEVIHLYAPTRWPQTRGTPWFHAVITTLQHLGKFEEAEIVKARLQACIAAFITSPEADDPTATGKVNGQNVSSLEPGIMRRLFPGEEITFSNPTSPGGESAPYKAKALEKISAGFGISYASLSHDYSKSNYSSSRLALLDERDNYRILQQWLIDHFHQVVYENWLDMAVLSGEINIPGYELDSEFYQECCWRARGWQWVDPHKEVSAATDSVRGGFKTLTDIAGEMGQDFAELVEQRLAEIKLTQEAGLVFDTDPSQVDQTGKTQPVETEEEDNPDEEGLKKAA